MPITFIEPQDLLAIEADALLNTVNCRGFMGKGVAKAFAQDRRFNPKRNRGKPKIGLEADYVERCENGLVKPGVPYVWESKTLGEQAGLFPDPSNMPRYVINLPTKDHYANPSKLVWIDSGLRHIRTLIQDYGMTSLAMPAPGCGNGGLDWIQVKELIERHLGDLSISITVVEPEPARDGYIER